MAQERREQPAGASPARPSTSTAPVHITDRRGAQRHRTRARVEPRRRALTVPCRVLVSPYGRAMRLQPQASRARTRGAHLHCRPVLDVETAR